MLVLLLVVLLVGARRRVRNDALLLRRRAVLCDAELLCSALCRLKARPPVSLCYS